MTRAPRICYFTNVYPAPSHTTMRREIRALEAEGAEVKRVAARRFTGPLVEREDQAEAQRTSYTADNVWHAAASLVAVLFSRPRRLATALREAVGLGIDSPRGVWKYLMYVGEACVLLQASRGCSHIHANFGNATAIATLCRRLGGPPVSLRIHGPEEFDSFSSREWDWKLSHADFVAPISRYGVRKVKATVAARHHPKVRLLRCGIDGIGASPSPALPRELKLVSVARLEDRKGHHVLLDAMQTLRAKGLAASLCLVGDGQLRRELETRVKQTPLLAGSVRFAGWGDAAAVRAAMEEARVVVLPSFAEGLPIVLMEALGRGRPVVATRVAGVPELVRHGETGWLVPAGDPHALAAALRAALLSPDEQLRRMVQRGQTLVAKQHDVAQLMRELLARLDPGLPRCPPLARRG